MIVKTGFIAKKFKWGGVSFTGGHLIVVFILLALYLASRLYRLTALPVFVDEAIYIRWGQIIQTEGTLRFVPLQDGKQPLFMWLAAIPLKFLSDPLFAGRLVSVFAGLATMAGLGLLPLLLGKKARTGLMAMFFYLVVPFTFFFDRLALVDGLLSAFGIWALNLAIILGKSRRLDVAMILGIVLGSAWLTKSPAVFFILMAPVVSFIFALTDKKLKRLEWLGLFGLVGIAVVFALIIYSILRLGPNFHMIGLRNQDYVWPLAEILKHPWDPLKPHLGDVRRYYLGYLTAPIVLLGLLGIAAELKLMKKNWPKLVLLGWWLGPLLVQGAMAKVFTARYILFGVPVFLLFAVEGIERLKNWIEKYHFSSRFLVLLFVPALFFVWQLWRSPVEAPLPRDERAGYLQDWTAGGGIRESADYIRSRPRERGIVVGTEGYFGTLPDGLQIYLQGEKDITVIGVGFPINAIPEPLRGSIKANNEVYLLVNKSRFAAQDNPAFVLAKEYPKPGGDKLLLFQLN